MERSNEIISLEELVISKVIKKKGKLSKLQVEIGKSNLKKGRRKEKTIGNSSFRN